MIPVAEYLTFSCLACGENHRRLVRGEIATPIKCPSCRRVVAYPARDLFWFSTPPNMGLPDMRVYPEIEGEETP